MGILVFELPVRKVRFRAPLEKCKIEPLSKAQLTEF